MNNEENSATEMNPSSNASAPESISGRAVFAVEMSPAGLVVRTVFLTQQNQLLEMPAVFPNLQYALAQIDDLRQIVIDRFNQAAQVGIQVMASQVAPRSNLPDPQPELRPASETTPSQEPSE